MWSSETYSFVKLPLMTLCHRRLLSHTSTIFVAPGTMQGLCDHVPFLTSDSLPPGCSTAQECLITVPIWPAPALGSLLWDHTLFSAQLRTFGGCKIVCRSVYIATKHKMSPKRGIPAKHRSRKEIEKEREGGRKKKKDML